MPILVITIFALLILTRTLFFLVRVVGWSMYPTYQPGDFLLALRYWPRHWLSRGQIVVWKMPSDLLISSMSESMDSKLYIKRIIGLPGDEVIAPSVKFPEVHEDEQIFQEQLSHKWHIPAGHCFVKGDSPSFDSTFFGPIPFHTLRGLILLRLPRRIRTAEEPYFINSSQFPHPPQKKP